MSGGVGGERRRTAAAPYPDYLIASIGESLAARKAG